MTKIIPLLLCTLFAANAVGQVSNSENATISYPAAYFEEYSPVTVNDMLDRIPGISLALEGEVIPRINSQQNQQRGLGGSDQILINGKRLAGKSNEARAQLDRIPAAQVEYIEIVRSNSADLDVQNSGQLVNIVLKESDSANSISGELGATLFQDGKLAPIGSFSFSGQSARLNYVLSADIKSGYEAMESFETSRSPDLSLVETRAFDRIRDQTTYSLNSSVVYNPSDSDRLAVNGLFSKADPPVELLRTITDLASSPASELLEREHIPATQKNWELGGDYQHNFSNSRFKALFIANERDNSVTRQRFVSYPPATSESPNLFLDTRSNYRERIFRSSYSWNLEQGQGLELGLERAQTIQHSQLRLGLPVKGSSSPAYGNLVPIKVPNAISKVEEIRYEGFAIHNWQINSRISLESSLLYEVSEISQSGEVSNTRDFDFIKPKIDLRYNMTNSLQLRLSIDKDISQLSFADFSANTNERDEDQDTISGNPELEQEEWWRYTLNADYRLPDDGGAWNTRLFYYDISKAIGRIDISNSPASLQATNGNVGDGTVYGVDSNLSIRLGFVGLDRALLTAGILLQESYIDDPLIARERRVVPFDRGNFRFGFRHDIPALNVNYGFNYRDGIDGNRPFWDIDNVQYIGSNSFLNFYAEKVGFAGFTFRFEAENLLDHESCRTRYRYQGYLRDGLLREIEDQCSTVGVLYSIKVRGNF
jgi:outer membrane receptor for ferrienterochelin and colicins